MIIPRITMNELENARRASIRRLPLQHLGALALLAATACGGGSTANSAAGGSSSVSTAGGAPSRVTTASGGSSTNSASGGASTSAPANGGAPNAATANGGASSGGATTSNTGSSGAPSVTPPSGVTINLGGVDVPKEHAIAFIHIGHSNMAGRATVPTASRPYHFTETNPHAWMYHVGMPPALAIEPKTAGDTAAAGPGTALVKEAAMRAPNDYFISLGFAVPSAYCSQFIPGGLYYDQLIAAPKAIKGRVTFGAIFIYLGITERHGSDADRTGFASCINTLVTAIRTDVGEPNLPMMINDYEVEGTGEFAVGGAVATAIMPQIAMIPSTVSNSALVSAKGLGMEDDHHFNLDGQLLWVQRAMMTMQDKGWFPWSAQ